jgi:hypothetical protein
VNTPWHHAVRPAATLTVAIGLLLLGHHQNKQASAQGGNPPLTGGIRQIPQAAGDQEASPRLFRPPSGQLFRVWNRWTDNGGGAILLAASVDGLTWRTLTELRPETSEMRAQDGRVAVNEVGDIALAYRWTRPRSISHVRLARSTETGKTWTIPTDNLDAAGGASDPRVAWGAGRTLLVAWVDARRGGRALDTYTRRSPDGGATWESEVLMTPPLSDQADVRYHAPRLLGDGKGRFWLVWIDSPVGRSTLRLRRSEDDGRTWSPAQDLSGEGRQILGHSLHRSGNRLLLTWQDQRAAPGRPDTEPSQPSLARIHATSSHDGGATWSPPVQVDGLPAGAPVSAAEPSSALTPSAEAWVAWHDGRNGRSDVFVARSLDAGLTWGTPLRLDADAPGTAESRFPRLAVSPDGPMVAVVWEDDRRGLEAVYGRFLSGGQWSGETRLGAVLPPKKAAVRPQVEAAGKDTFYVVWEIWDYSHGHTPRRSGLDDTVVVPR